MLTAVAGIDTAEAMPITPITTTYTAGEPTDLEYCINDRAE
jgi:hypothetical protein